MARDNVLGVCVSFGYVCVCVCVWSFCRDKCMINYFIICKLVFASLRFAFPHQQITIAYFEARRLLEQLHEERVLCTIGTIYMYTIVVIVKCIK